MTRKSGTASDSEQLRAEVEQAREDLADTVAELAGKADVKAHAREMAAHAKSKALFEVNEAKARMQHTAEEAADRGFTRPGPAIAVVGGLGAAALAVYLVLHRHQMSAGRHWTHRGHGALGKRSALGKHGAFGKHGLLGRRGMCGKR